MTQQVKKVLFVECGIGTKGATFYLVDAVNAADQKYMDDYAWESALDHASSYGVYPMSEKPEEYDDEEHGGWQDDEYSDDIECWWEDYVPEEHDGWTMSGKIQWMEM